ncbi:MAG: hypothetical protein SFX73_24965 [Kofleriaceae bacterium]|nr:hypothetical protein [Kofleriaceae bacterium]
MMPKPGTSLVPPLLVGTFATIASAQPGMTPVVPPAPEGQPAASQAPLPPTPPPGATQATFVSTNSDGWDVLIDQQPACGTPCSIYVPPMRFVTLRARSQERNRVLLEVGYLPQGSVVVRGKPLSQGAYAGGIVGTTFAGLGLVTGISLTAVGCATDHDGMCTAGLITGGVSAVGLYLSIKLLQSAVPKAEVLPGTPYVSGNTVGLAGSF